MKLPVQPEDVKIVQGQSGRGLQFVCDCGCINWQHVEILEATWTCRNCRQILAYNFPALVQKALARAKQEAPASAPSASSV